MPDTTGCAACHLDYSAPVKPESHTTNNWTVCEECHVGNVTWAGGGYQHTGITNNCAECHLDYSTPPRSASAIDHSAFTTLESICEECHSGFTDWTGGDYEHSGGSGICHTCHLGYSTPVRSTPHTGVQFAGAGDSDCELCHTTEGEWSFVHVPDTTGCAVCHLDYSAPVKPESHTTNNWTVCEECHVGNVAWTTGSYQHTGITSGCADCHLDYSTPPRPSNHITNNWTICEDCHDSINVGTSWLTADYKHIGVKSNCARCHINYSIPTKPQSHITNNWTICEDCHSGYVTWAGGSWKHTGVQTGCAECHLDYSTPPRSASAIDHTAFTTLESVCEECHSGFTVWTGGNYDHSGSAGICHTCHLGYSTPVRTTPHTGVQFAGAGR